MQPILSWKKNHFLVVILCFGLFLGKTANPAYGRGLDQGDEGKAQPATVAPSRRIVKPLVQAPSRRSLKEETEKKKAKGQKKKKKKIDPDELQLFEAKEVVVTRSRTPKRVKDTPVKVEVISKARIEAKGAANVAQALQGEVGIRVSSECSICNATTVKLSGLPGRYTLLLIDGVPMFSSLGTTYGFLFFNAADIARLEVVKGASSVRHGTDAIGGVINIITRRPAEAGKAELNLEAGMFGYHQMSAYTSLKKGPVGVSLVATHSGQNKIDHDGDRVTESAGYARTSASAIARWNPRKRTEVMLRLAGIQDQLQGGGIGQFLSVMDSWNPLQGTGRRAFSESILTKRVEGVLKVTHKFMQPVWMESVASLVYHFQDSDYEGVQYWGKQYMLYLAQGVGWKAHKSFTFLAGGSYRMENLKENLALSEYQYHMPGLYAEGQLKPVKKIELVAGLRYDWHNKFTTYPTARLNLKLKPYRWFTIRAGTGTAFRAPTTFYEYEHGVRPQGYNIVMDTDKAETSVSANLAISLKYKEWVKVSVDGAFTRVQDPISVEATDEGNLRVFNVDKPLYVTSLETQLESRPWKHLTLEAGYGHYVYKDDGSALVAAPPVHHFTFSATFQHEKMGMKVYLSGQAVGPMDLRKVYGFGYNALPGTRGEEYLDSANADLTRPKLRRSPWWGVVNIRVEQRVTKWLFVHLGIDNIFDYHQNDKETPLFYPSDGPGMPAQPLNVVYIWGPLKGRFIYGGLKLKI